MANPVATSIDAGLARGSGLLGYCRQGFEPELAAELSERAGAAGMAGYARAQRNDGYVVFACDEDEALDRALPWRDLVFARQLTLGPLPENVAFRLGAVLRG
jgi:23S rRNA C2498 (ribose-2'-O)-methylase RlmM